MLRKTKPQIEQPIKTEQAPAPIAVGPIAINDDTPTEEEIAAGLYTFAELQELGFIRDRTDLLRKQRKYHFPMPIKTTDRQAPFLKSRVHDWIRYRAVLSRERKSGPGR